MEVQDLASQATTDSATADQSAAVTAAPAAESAAPAEKPSRPEWLPESYFDAETGAIKLDDFGKHYGEIAAAQAAEAERLKNYPQKAEELEFTLPADLKLPEGMTFDDKNPQFQAFRNFAFDKKLDPAVGGEMLAMYVREKVGEVEAINARVKEEVEKLGANGPARISTLRTFFDGMVGKDLSQSLMAGVFTAPQVQAMEKMMLALTNQGATDLNGGQRDTTEPEKTIVDRWYGDNAGKAS